MQKNYKELLNDITTFILDLDGVLTDGSVLVTSTGEMLRRMNIKDGYGLKIAVEKGYNVCIISGSVKQGIKERLKRLGVTDIYMGPNPKQDTLKEYLSTHNISPKNALYMGDDLLDLPAMKEVALAASPQDAVAEVKAISHYVSHKNGGEGCVRDVVEQVLKVRGDWDINIII